MFDSLDGNSCFKHSTEIRKFMNFCNDLISLTENHVFSMSTEMRKMMNCCVWISASMNFCMSEFLHGNCGPYRKWILKGFGSAQHIYCFLLNKLSSFFFGLSFIYLVMPKSSGSTEKPRTYLPIASGKLPIEGQGKFDARKENGKTAPNLGLSHWWKTG